MFLLLLEKWKSIIVLIRLLSIALVLHWRNDIALEYIEYIDIFKYSYTDIFLSYAAS